MYRTNFVLILFLARIELATTQRILGTTIITTTVPSDIIHFNKFNIKPDYFQSYCIFYLLK